MKLAERIERKKLHLADALAASRGLRTARGPWAETNRRANAKRIAKLDRELKALYLLDFRAKMAAS